MLAESMEYLDALRGRFGEASSAPEAMPIQALRSAFDESIIVSPKQTASIPEALLLRTAQHALLAHFVDGDAKGVGAWIEFLGGVSSLEASSLSTLGAAWSALLHGKSGPDLEPTIDFARREKRPALLVDALCASTLLSVRSGGEGATDLARKAVRIARAEEMIQQEYLANVVLASCRRREGRPYLAARILTELRHVACGRWSSWIEWEHQLADPFAETTAKRAEPLRQARRACVEGRLEFLAARIPARCPADADEVEELRRALDPRGPGLPMEELGFKGWQTAPDADEPYGRWILVDPVGTQRTLSALALTLSDGEGYERCPVLGSGQVRAAQVLAVLARRAGEALPTEEVFQAVYGFAYVPAKHSSVLRSGLKRVRIQLRDLGNVDRPTPSTLRLQAKQRLSVPDPESVLSLEERILRILSRTPTSSAELARLLRVSKRQVQNALPDLVAQGCCSMEKAGRAVHYNVEDTTFVVPTFARVQPVLSGD